MFNTFCLLIIIKISVIISFLYQSLNQDCKPVNQFVNQSTSHIFSFFDIGKIFHLFKKESLFFEKIMGQTISQFKVRRKNAAENSNVLQSLNAKFQLKNAWKLLLKHSTLILSTKNKQAKIR